MLPTLRDYQNKVVCETYAHIRQGERRILIVAPTGAGKTHTAAKIVRDAVNVDHKVMFVVHRDALISQAVKSFAKWGLSCGVVSGNHKENRFPPVQICSFQSLGRERDLSWLKPGLVISDEAHVTSYTSIMLQRFPKLREGRNSNEPVYIGLTATPWRLKRNECLGDIFPVMVKAPSYRQLIRMGNLVQPVYYEIPNSYGKDMAADIHYIIAQWKKWAQNSPTFAFTESIPFAKALAKAFEEEGINSVAIHEGTSAKKRDRYFDDFNQEKIKVLTTCIALVEGVDIPKARVAILARNSESPSFYFQAVGRVMRPYTYPDGDIKTDCLILDQMGLVSRFGLIEDLEITEKDLFDSTFRERDEAYQDKKPVKKCPRCEQMVSAGLRKCQCGYEFERLDLSDRFLPSGDMQILWKNEAQKVHYAQYQKMLRIACAKNLPFRWADETFLHTYGYFAPSDWRRNAVIPPDDPNMRKVFEEYLQAIAAAESRDPVWISRQLSLELGM